MLGRRRFAQSRRWRHLHKGRAGSPFTNAQIASWAILPLANEQVSLVGDSYNPQRAGWSDAAYKSSINTLNALYGFNLPGVTATPSGPLPSFGKSKKPPPGLRHTR